MNFLNFLGSNSSSNSSFNCPHCGKRTPHTKMTLTEYCSINDPNDMIQKASAIFFDTVQLTKVVNIAGISYWKCCNCGLTTIRKSDGSIDTIGKKGK